MSAEENQVKVECSTGTWIGMPANPNWVSGDLSRYKDKIPHLLEMRNGEGKTVLIIDADQAQADISMDKEMILDCLNAGITHGNADRIRRNTQAYDHLLQASGMSEEELHDMLDPLLVCFLNGFHKRMVQRLTREDTYPSNKAKDE